MTENARRTLDLLRQELEFVEGGGYKRCLHSPWRAPYLFEESPSCPNHSDKTRSHACQDCWLMQFVPAELRDEQVPCRFIQLTHTGTTVDSLYRSSSHADSEEILRQWLLERIHELEVDLGEADRIEAFRRAS